MNLTIGSGVGDNTFTFSLEIPSSSVGGTSTVAGTEGITLTSNLGLPADSTDSTSAVHADTHTTKKQLKLTEKVIRSLVTLVCLGKHNTHKPVYAQVIQHGNDNRQKEIGKRICPELGYRHVDRVVSSSIGSPSLRP
jgi:hypothetical protein